MALRSYWKGYLKLSLVSCSVALYAATSSSERVRFNMLNRATRNRLKQQYVDAVTGDPVASDERIRGYAVEKEEYVTVENEELFSYRRQGQRSGRLGGLVRLAPRP